MLIIRCNVIYTSTRLQLRLGAVLSELTGTGTEMMRIVDVAIITKMKINCNVMVTQNDRANLCFIGIQRK